MNLKPFLAWCTAKGIVSPLDVRENRHGGSSSVFRYTVLRDEIDRSTDKTRIFLAPLSACITAPSNEALADRLLYEKSLGDASIFAPYLATLPSLDDDSYLATLPRFWSRERLDCVSDGGCLLEQVEMDARDRLKGRDPWAMAVVDSRCNLLADRSYALTPLMDFLNHDGAIPTTARVLQKEQQQHFNHNDLDDESIFVLEVSTATLPSPVNVSEPELEMVVVPEEKKKSILNSLFPFMSNTNSKQNENRMTTSAKDDFNRHQEEVCISYGDLTNLQTLLNYGFVLLPNPHNVEVVSVPLLGLPAPIAVECDARGRVDPLALGALRRALATPEELSTALPNEWTAQLETFSMSPYLTPRNELEVHAVLAGFVQQAVQDAEYGALAAKRQDDTLVADYLRGRAATLQLTLDKIQSKFPQVLLE